MPNRLGGLWQLTLMIGALGLLALVSPLTAKGQSTAAPTIQTTDAYDGMETSVDSLHLRLVILGKEPITEVYINGVLVPIVSADTVLVEVNIPIRVGLNQIVVRAISASGAEGTETYMVTRLSPEELEASNEEPTGQWNLIFSLQGVVDGNPTGELSLPPVIKILAGLDATGFVIPATGTEDWRNTITLVSAYKSNTPHEWGTWSTQLGIVETHYANVLNDLFNSTVAFAGFGITQDEATFTSTFMDINAAGGDFAQFIILAVQKKTTSTDENEVSIVDQQTGEFTNKLFANTALTDGYQLVWKWLHTETPPVVEGEGTESYQRLLQLGQSEDGTAESYNYFFRSDWSWKNKWAYGWLLDYQLGLGYRKYPAQTPLFGGLGLSRNDLELKAGLQAGYEFMAGWNLLLQLEYTSLISNSAPYTRPIYGIQLNGMF